MPHPPVQLLLHRLRWSGINLVGQWPLKYFVVLDAHLPHLLYAVGQRGLTP